MYTGFIRSYTPKVHSLIPIKRENKNIVLGFFEVDA